MSNYYLILVWVAIVGVISLAVNVQRLEIVCDKNVYRYQPLWAVIIFLPLIIWTAYRGHVGDTGVYMEMYKDLPGSFGGIPSYMATVTKDKGFYFLTAIIRCIVGQNVNVYFLILAVVQAMWLIRVYRKYSTHYIVTFFLFIASTDYVSWMFNGIRQFLAVTITFACFELILKKKYMSIIIVILIASTIHESALLVLPFVFIVQGKAWNKKTLIFIAAIIIAVAFVGRFTNLLDTMLAETQYKNVVSDWQEWQDDGTNVIRVLVYAVPSILSLIGLKHIKLVNDPIINLCTNMSIVSVGFYVVSMFTSGLFIGRLPIYFSLYNYILLPWEIDNIFTEKSAKLVYLFMIGAYLVFYYYQIKITWGLV